MSECIYPSYWADYLAKVAEMTRLPIDYIWTKLSYARGLQFVTVWTYRQGLKCRVIEAALGEASIMRTPL